MNRVLRLAKNEEMDEIYLMGFDVWSDGSSKDIYLNECGSSPKYAKGNWYVLEEGEKLCCSLVVYNLGKNKFGIGSLATPINLRNQGYASLLMKEIISFVQNDNFDAVLFLYSDIRPDFYEKFGFKKIQEDLQRYKTTTCMVLSKQEIKFYDKEDTPLYF